MSKAEELALIQRHADELFELSALHGLPMEGPEMAEAWHARIERERGTFEETFARLLGQRGMLSEDMRDNREMMDQPFTE